MRFRLVHRVQQIRPLAVPRSGMTLVELLAVIAIIGLLLGLLLPAMQAARESARRSHCQNNLKQIGLAALSHVLSQGHFPSGGWGYRWTGDPDMGFGKKQPGGWWFSLLPFMEQTALWSIGAGQPLAVKYQSLMQVRQTSLPVAYCPSRRPAIAYPSSSWAYLSNAGIPPVLAKTDYAASEGTNYYIYVGPAYPGCISTYPNCAWASTPLFNGIVTLNSEVVPAAIRDGASQTMFVAEKYLQAQMYAGTLTSDDGGPYEGCDYDTARSTNAGRPPMQDTPGLDLPEQFGSAHAGNFSAVMCDGSVRAIDYTINPTVFSYLGSRRSSSGRPSHPAPARPTRRETCLASAGPTPGIRAFIWGCTG